MITLDLFKKAINTIQKLEEDNRKLSNILINDNSCGFCDFGGELIQTFLDVLHADFEMFDEDPILEWWLYETNENNPDSRRIWEYTDNGKIIYNLNKLDDLYYYMCKDYKKVNQEFLKGVTKCELDKDLDNETRKDKGIC